MARPKKQGLDYFSFDVGFFHDAKIKRLKSRFGTKGIAVYIRLLCGIYEKGYWISYDEDLILDVADDVGISENATTEIVDFLLSRRLFDTELAKSDKVLTSKSIQLRYREVKERSANRKAEIEGRYWLLKESSCTSAGAYPKLNFAPQNTNKSAQNTTFYADKPPKEKKSKVKKSNSVSESDAAFPPSLAEVQTYAVSIANRKDAVQIADKFYSYYQGTGWKTKNSVPITNWKGTLQHWINTEKEKASPNLKKEVPQSDNAEAYKSFIYNIDE